jgi:hypothetical protein
MLGLALAWPLWYMLLVYHVVTCHCWISILVVGCCWYIELGLSLLLSWSPFYLPCLCLLERHVLLIYIFVTSYVFVFAFAVAQPYWEICQWFATFLLTIEYSCWIALVLSNNYNYMFLLNIIVDINCSWLRYFKEQLIFIHVTSFVFDVDTLWMRLALVRLFFGTCCWYTLMWHVLAWSKTLLLILFELFWKLIFIHVCTCNLICISCS